MLSADILCKIYHMSEIRVAADDGVEIHVEWVGDGEAILFIHEFAGDHRSWEPQVRRFCRSYRCVTFCARGYLPSDVPGDPAQYSQQRAVDDAIAVLDGLDISSAHIFGISMGGFTALHLGLQHPARVRSILVAGTGYGAHPDEASRFREECAHIADRFETLGSAGFAREYLSGPARVQFQNKDPIGWRRLVSELAEHSTAGAVLTMRGVQRQRPSLYRLEADLSAMTIPVLILAGDEDDGCLTTSLWLKRVIPSAGLSILAKSGHTLNLEEPEAVNTIAADFLALVSAGAWGPRDSRAVPGSIAGDFSRES